jgi:hypothetical protein
MTARSPAQREPACPICRTSVLPGDHVISDHGAPVHLDCHLGTRGVRDAVSNFLKEHAGRPFCDRCLGRYLDLTQAEASKATARLRLTVTYKAVPAICCTCGQKSVTTRTEVPPSVN